MATALLVIDLQVGVLEGCYDADGVVDRIGTLVERARAAGVPVVWVQHVDEELPLGSPAWQLVAGLAPAPEEPRVCKAYYDAFAGTPLRALLEERGVRRLVIAGAQSDCCIRSTAQRAAAEGYALVVCSDAHTTAASECDAGALSGEQIVAHTNRYLAGLRYPGVDVALATHDMIAF